MGATWNYSIPPGRATHIASVGIGDHLVKRHRHHNKEVACVGLPVRSIRGWTMSKPTTTPYSVTYTPDAHGKPRKYLGRLILRPKALWLLEQEQALAKNRCSSASAHTQFNMWIPSRKYASETHLAIREKESINALIVIRRTGELPWFRVSIFFTGTETFQRVDLPNFLARNERRISASSQNKARR